MLELAAAVGITVCMSYGLILRYAPFASVVTPAQKRTLLICYTTLTVLNMAVVVAGLHIWDLMAAFGYLRFGCILYAAILTMVNIIVIRGRIREHLFVFGVVITCHYLLLAVPNYVITLLPGCSATVYLFVVLGVYCVLLLLSHWPLRKLVCHTVEPFLQMNSGEYWNTIWFIPIAFFGTKFLSLGGEHDAGSIQQLISSGLYVVIIILTCMSISTDQERMRAQQALEKQLADQKIHYAELKVRVEDARKTNHDFKHHITAIHHYIDIDDKEGLREYCNELLERTDGQGRIPYTGNAAADGVLYHYMQQAQKENINFQCAGTFRIHGIADVDLCVLLGNALDNAITACLTIQQDRSINVIGQSDGQLLSVVVRNTFDGEVLQSGEDLLSRKRQNRRGVGISSMRSICERYGGSLDIRWDERSFTLMFILPLTDES